MIERINCEWMIMDNTCYTLYLYYIFNINNNIIFFYIYIINKIINNNNIIIINNIINNIKILLITTRCVLACQVLQGASITNKYTYQKLIASLTHLGHFDRNDHTLALFAQISAWNVGGRRGRDGYRNRGFKG